MPLSFASSQNSLLSTTRARSYDEIKFFHLFKRFFWRQERYLKTAPHNPYSHLTPYLHVVDDACAPRELERVSSMVICSVNHSKRLLFDTYAVLNFSLLLARALPITEEDRPPLTPHPSVDWDK